MEVISITGVGKNYELTITIAGDLAPFIEKHDIIGGIHVLHPGNDIYSDWIKQYPGLKMGDIVWATNDYVVLRPGKIKVVLHRTKLFAALDEIHHVNRLHKTFTRAKSV